MSSSFYRLRYLFSKARDSLASGLKSYEVGQISGRELLNRFLKDTFQERMTIIKKVKGEEMAPTLSAQEETVLIRKIPFPCFRNVFVGDVVLHKDPSDPQEERVRRVAAVEGDEIESSDPNDRPFVLEKGSCWVLCDNESMSLKVAKDSRWFGPLPMKNILGRVIYAYSSSSDHGYINNSEDAKRDDSPILAVELDIDELSRGDEL